MSISNQTSAMNKVTEIWDFLFVDLADPRTNDWPLIRNPLPLAIIIGSYLYFVISWGPRFMANRKPFKMQKLLVVYNFLQVLVSLYISYEGLFGAYLSGNYSLRCQPVDFTRSELGMRAARGAFVYFIAKVTELLDTVFFVLRKKDQQVTFLHLYHHSCMPMISWGATKYFPGGHAVFIGWINSVVHVVMYTYYMLAALGPKYQKYLWWKKHITNLQMLQFGLAFLHSAQLLYTDCGFPKFSMFFTLPNAIFFYILFNDFYNKAYKEAQDKRAKAEKEKSDQLNGNSKGVPNGNLPIIPDDSAQYLDGKKIQ